MERSTGQGRASGFLILPENTPGTEVFRAVPNDSGEIQRLAFLGLAPMLALPVASLGLFAILPAWRYSWEGALVCVAPIALGIYLALLFMPWLNFRYWERVRLRDALMLGPVTEGERYVGISFYGSPTCFRMDSAWERGYLSVGADFFVYRGLATSFRMPLSAITGVHVIKKTGLSGFDTPLKMLVQWRHPESRSNALLVELREGPNLRRAKVETYAIEAQLRAAASSAHSESDDEDAVWPFESGRIDVLKLPRPATRADKSVAVAWGFGGVLVASIVVCILSDSLHLDLTPFAGIVAVPTFSIVYGCVIVFRTRPKV